MDQLLWKALGQFLKTLDTELSSSLELLLRGFFLPKGNDNTETVYLKAHGSTTGQLAEGEANRVSTY